MMVDEAASEWSAYNLHQLTFVNRAHVPSTTKAEYSSATSCLIIAPRTE
jgi:hypothetical protein